MKNLENEYKNRFSEQKIPVGKAESDSLWMDISDSLERTESPLTRFKKIGFPMLLLLLLSVATGIYYFYPQGISLFSTVAADKTVTYAEYTSVDSHTKMPHHVPDIENSNQVASAKKTIEAQFSDLILLEEAIKKPPTSSATKEKLAERNLVNPENGRQVVQTPSTISDQTHLELVVDVVHQVSSNPPIWATNAIGTASALSENTVSIPYNAPTMSVGTYNNIAPLASLPAITVSLKKEWPRFVLPITAFEEKKSSKKNRSRIEWQVAAETGINTIALRYKANDKSDVATQKNITEQPGWGKNTAVRTGFSWKNKWVFTTGLEYHQYWVTFKYEQKEIIQVLKTNQLLQVLINAANADTLQKTFNDTLINAVATRNVLHNNAFHQIGIPVEIGIKKNAGKWVFGINVGAVVNLTTLQSGKILDNNLKIIAFDKGDAAAPFKKIGIGFCASPMLGYQISKNWTLLLRPQWAMQRKTNLMGTDLRVSAHTFNVNLGLHRTLR